MRKISWLLPLLLLGATRNEVPSGVSGDQVPKLGRNILYVLVALTALNMIGCASSRSAPLQDTPPKVAVESKGDLASAPSGPAMVPVWQVGDEWQYAYKSPSVSWTYVASVNRVESVDGVPHYVVNSGNQEVFYRVSDLAFSLVREDGVVVSRDKPPWLLYAWPLAVGKSWEQNFVEERPVDRQTMNRDTLDTVDAEETITVPAGTFRTLKIVGRNRNTNALTYEGWYAPDVKTFVRTRTVLKNGIGERELLAFKLASAPATESFPALSGSAPHIDAVNLREDRSSGNLVVFQDVIFRALNGDAKFIHWELVDKSTQAPSIDIRDAVITVSSEQQKQSGIHTGRWGCGAINNVYTVTLRVTILTTDGIRSNPFDYTIRCT
jgi:hypothetical protein